MARRRGMLSLRLLSPSLILMILLIMMISLGCADLTDMQPRQYEDKGDMMYNRQPEDYDGYPYYLARIMSQSAEKRAPYRFIYRRSCIARGRSCDARRRDCCDRGACRCNLWGTNCKCMRAGLLQSLWS